MQTLGRTVMARRLVLLQCPVVRNARYLSHNESEYKRGRPSSRGNGTRSIDTRSSDTRSRHQNASKGYTGKSENRQRNNHQRRPPPHVTKEWEQATQDLLHLSQWDPSHKRKAQQCLHHWSRNRLSLQNQHMLPELWNRVQKEVPQQETSAAMYDFTVLALAKNGFATPSLEVFLDFIKTNFKHVSQNDRHSPSSYHLNAVASSLSRSMQAQVAQDLLMTMYRDGPIKPNVYSVTSVLDGWSKLGEGQKAQDLLDYCVQQQGLNPSIVSYNAVMAAWSRSKSPDAYAKAHALFKSLTPTVSPDVATWSSYLKACKDPSTMEANLWTAYRSGQPLNCVCFNVVLNAWGKKGRVDRAEAFVTSWVQLLASERDLPREMWPQLTTFNTLLNALARVGNSDRAKYWLKEMQKMGVTPDNISYNCLIDALAKQGKAQEAHSVWEAVTMDPKNDAYACNTILSAFANHARQIDGNKDEILQRAFVFFGAMEGRGLPPSVITYNTLLKVISACNRPEETELLLKKMEAGPFKPDIVSYTVVIDAFAKASNPQKAHSIHRFMTVEPSVVSFNSVIHSYSKWNDPTAAEQAESILVEMRDAGVEPDLMTYCSLLTVWTNNRHDEKAKRALCILDQMMANYESLAPQHRNAEELVRNAHTMVLACCAYLPVGSPHEDEAKQIAMETFGKIRAPNFVSYATYLQALHRLEIDVVRRDGMISEAFLQYCRSENSQINSLVLRRLQNATTPEMYETLLAKGQNIHVEKGQGN